METIITIWGLLILAIATPIIISVVNFRKQVKNLNEEFNCEARRIDELEKIILIKT